MTDPTTPAKTTLRAILSGDAAIPVTIESVEGEGFLRRTLRRIAAGQAGKGFGPFVGRTFGGEPLKGFDPDRTLLRATMHVDGRTTVTIEPESGPSLVLRRTTPDTYDIRFSDSDVTARSGEDDGRRTIETMLTEHRP
jgi:hypothetical protein